MEQPDTIATIDAEPVATTDAEPIATTEKPTIVEETPLVWKRVVYSNGAIAQGGFIGDKQLYGKKIKPNGEYREGEFDLTTGYLIKGEINEQCAIQKGIFDATTESLIKGVIEFNDGTVCKGEFITTEKKCVLKKGRLILNGDIQEGEFKVYDCGYSALYKGTLTFSTGEVQKGEFQLFPHNGKIHNLRVVKGIRYHCGVTTTIPEDTVA